MFHGSADGVLELWCEATSKQHAVQVLLRHPEQRSVQTCATTVTANIPEEKELEANQLVPDLLVKWKDRSACPNI